MTAPFVAICNPISGRCSALPRVLHLQRSLRERGAELVIRTTEHAGHATTLAAEAPRDTPAIIVAGGDGTLSEVANGLRGRTTPIALLPTGTENLLGRSLGLPENAQQAAHVLLNPHIQPRDAAEANGRIFLSVGGVGFDAECVARLCRGRCGHITHLDYVFPIWRTFCEHKFPWLTVIADGDARFNGQGLVIFGIMDRYAVGLPVLPGADPADGLLDVSVFPCSTRWQLLHHAGSVALGGLNATAINFKCKHLTITSRHFVFSQLDGERGPGTPIECRIHPAYLRIVAGNQKSVL